MMRRTEFESPIKPGRRDVWLIGEAPADWDALPCDTSSLPMHDTQWTGARNLAEAQRWAKQGKPSCVAPSEALLAKLEPELEKLTSARRTVVHDVCGSAPNVAAYLSGSPLAMRRRAVEQNDTAPIGIIVDCMLSAGVSHEEYLARGATILALVRLLSARRAVELYAVCGAIKYEPGTRKHGASFHGFRLDTAPLDLARAAYILTDASATRCLFFSKGEAQRFYDSCISWAYGDNRIGAMSPKLFEKTARLAFPHLSEFIAIPGGHLCDDTMKLEPLTWLRSKLEQYGACDD